MARTRRAAAPVEPIEDDDAFEELEDDTDDADELEDVEEAPAPKTTRGRKAAPAKATTKAAPKADDANPYNSAWLAAHVTEQTGVPVDSRSLRMLLRKMAAAGELERTVGEDRNRYSFPKGANDPTVKAVVRKVKAGELTVAKREGLDKVKTTTGAKKAAPAKDAAPAATRRAAAKDATPAKAAPSRRRRAAAPAE